MKKIKEIIIKSAVLIAIIFLFSKCGPNDSLVPLNKVEIPEYEDNDYIELLKSDNPELVYNAICNLIPKANNYARTLSCDTIKDIKAKNNARLIYSLITKNLSSDNEWILCSSLRFYAYFGDTYKNKEELANNLSKVKLKTKSVKLEFVNSAKTLYGMDLSRFNNLAKEYYSSKSWIVSRYVFSLMPFFKNDLFYDYYSPKFNSSQEYDKLLFVNSLDSGYNDKVLDFVLNSISLEKSKKVRISLVKSLGKAKNFDKVNSWLSKNVKKISDISLPISNFYIESFYDTSNTKVLICLYYLNYIPDNLICSSESKLLGNLNEYVNYPDSIKKKNKYVQNLYELIHSNPRYKECWNNYQSEKSNPDYSKDFTVEQLMLLEKYKSEVSKLYDKYEIDQKFKNKYVESIDYLKSEFKNNKK